MPKLVHFLSVLGGPVRLLKRSGTIAVASLWFVLIGSGATAQDNSSAAELELDPATVIERIHVIGSRERLLEIPGAATYVGVEDIARFEYGDINRILRQVPGINIQEEDGFGLRPNIGIRGTGIDRSSKITLMEDGVLIAPAPYAAPAAYYFPTAGRLESIGVRKGSSTIKFGPRTTGGAINLVSTSIPEETGGSLNARFGENDHKEVHAILAAKSGPLSFMLETFQADNDGFKSLPGGGDTGFNIEDYLAKIRYEYDKPDHRYQLLELKLGLVDQRSNETYLGLTDADFQRDPFARYAASANDQFNSKHHQIQGTHFIELNGAMDITTLAYYNKFERDWFKLDDLNFGDGRGRIRPGAIFSAPDDPLNVAALAILRGDADSIDDALQLRHNARQYYSWGVQSILNVEITGDLASHAIEFGVRYHGDQEDRLQNREGFRMDGGTMVRTSVGAPGSQANRLADAEALALFVLDEINIGRFRLVPGLRFETVKLSRRDFSTSDPERLLGPTRSRENRVSTFIPGLGLMYRASDDLSLLAGIHKGFSPPGPSQSNAAEEESINIEAGLRYRSPDFGLEAIGFFNDYTNLLGTCTNAVGCATGDIGDQFNGGQVDVFGVEFSGDLERELSDRVTGRIRFNYTLTDASFRTTFSDGFWGDVTKGDKLPYIPRHQAFIALDLELQRVGGSLAFNYVSDTQNTAGQGLGAALDNIPSRIISDLSLYVEPMDRVRLYLTVENLFDKTHIVARRPYGPRPGKPRTVLGGLKVSF